jgi:hypothetical protein
MTAMPQKAKNKGWKNVPKRIQTASAVLASIIAICTTIGSILAWFEGKMTEHLDTRIDTLESTVNDIRQDTVRLQLDNLINSDSDNIESILNVAKVYFIDMQGDWYMTEKFKRWGREHDVDLSDFNFTSHSSASHN